MDWLRFNRVKIAIRRFLISLFLCFALLLTLWLLVLVDVSHSKPALALVRQQQEGQGQMLYQVRHTLRDSMGSPWQVVFFKRVQGDEVKNIHLRLVGFPEGIVFQHPQSLTLSTNGGLILQAEDLFAQQSPAPNVGQYEMSNIVSQLPTSESITLTLPLETPRQMFVPIPVLLEWQSLNQPSI